MGKKFTESAIPTTFDGKKYCSRYMASKENHKRLGLSFRGLYEHLKKGRTTSEQVLRSTNHKESFIYKKRKWYSNSACAIFHGYSDSGMRYILKKEGIRSGKHKNRNTDNI